MQVIIAFSQDLEGVFKLHLVPQLFHDFFHIFMSMSQNRGRGNWGGRGIPDQVFLIFMTSENTKLKPPEL